MENKRNRRNLRRIWQITSLIYIIALVYTCVAYLHYEEKKKVANFSIYLVCLYSTGFLATQIFVSLYYLNLVHNETIIGEIDRLPIFPKLGRVPLRAHPTAPRHLSTSP